MKYVDMKSSSDFVDWIALGDFVKHDEGVIHNN